MSKKICITNRNLVEGDFLEQMRVVLEQKVDMVILREKDLSADEYEILSKKMIRLCDEYHTCLVLHTFTEIARKLKHSNIHVSYSMFLAEHEALTRDFEIVGVSTHSVEEACICQTLGASYITVSHIYETSCKEGLAPRGIDFLKDVVAACENRTMEIYALGGIHLYNEKQENECVLAGADGVCMMSDYMKLEDRYIRQATLSSVGSKGQEILRKSKVLVVGAGGLGSPVISYLAGAGIGTIGVCDADMVSVHNLHRQVLHEEAKVGMNKAISAEEYIKKHNRDVAVITYPYMLTDENAEHVVQEYDLVIDCVDNFKTKYLLNDLCIANQKPLVHGGVLGMTGQVLTVLAGKGPCLRCLFGDSDSKKDLKTCKDIGVLGPVVGVIGSVMATEAIRVLLGMEKLLVGRMFTFDGTTMESRIVPFPNRNPRCSCNHHFE